MTLVCIIKIIRKPAEMLKRSVNDTQKINQPSDGNLGLSDIDSEDENIDDENQELKQQQSNVSFNS